MPFFFNPKQAPEGIGRGAGVVRGDYTNTVAPLTGGRPAGASASATVTIVADPDFEQTSIVGTVFDDRDGDGWQDDGERGVPGVRLATVLDPDGNAITLIGGFRPVY